MKIEIVESTQVYKWEALLAIKGNYLIGEGRSLKPNSPSRDCVQLKVSNQGDAIYGIGISPHIDEKLVTFKFVFAKMKKA